MQGKKAFQNDPKARICLIEKKAIVRGLLFQNHVGSSSHKLDLLLFSATSMIPWRSIATPQQHVDTTIGFRHVNIAENYWVV